MSLKPLKKTDMNKSWMKKRRDKQIKIQPEYHLIVTEGTKQNQNILGQFVILSTISTKIEFNLIFMGRVKIHLIYLTVRKNMPIIVQIYINMFGLFMIRMIFHQIISIKRHSYVKTVAMMRLRIMRFGRINVLNYGFFYILAIFNRIYIGRNIGKSLVNQ